MVEKISGTWEMLPDKRENAETFWDKTNLPEELRKIRRGVIVLATFRVEKDALYGAFGFKGSPDTPPELKFPYGETVEIPTPDGATDSIVVSTRDGMLCETHKSVYKESGLKRDYTAQSRVEGNELIRVYSSNGVTMTNVYKRIA